MGAETKKGLLITGGAATELIYHHSRIFDVAFCCFNLKVDSDRL
jgi:hypothetical protein